MDYFFARRQHVGDDNKRPLTNLSIDKSRIPAKAICIGDYNYEIICPAHYERFCRCIRTVDLVTISYDISNTTEGTHSNDYFNVAMQETVTKISDALKTKVTISIFSAITICKHLFHKKGLEPAG